MNRRFGFLFAAAGLTAAALTASGVETAAERRVTLLVVPERYTILEMSLDIARFRPVSILSYSKGKSGQTVLQVRESLSAQWARVAVQDYQSGAAFQEKPAAVILVGSAEEIPAVLIAASAWCKDVRRVPVLNLVELINSANEVLSFSEGEWRWFSQKYKLQLKDLNEERRRHGRYIRRGEKPPATEKPTAPVLDEVPAPVPVEPAAQRPPSGTAPSVSRPPAPEDK